MSVDVPIIFLYTIYIFSGSKFMFKMLLYHQLKLNGTAKHQVEQSPAKKIGQRDYLLVII